MGTGTGKLKKRNLWDSFCEVVSHAWLSLKVKFRVVNPPLVQMENINDSFTGNVFDDSDEAPRTVRTSVAKPELCRAEIAPQPTSMSGLIPVNEGETRHSSLTVSAAQQSEKNADDKIPANMFTAGVIFLGIAGALAAAGGITQIYGLFALAGLMAIIGGVLCATAYALNDQEKNGALLSQVFPEKCLATAVMGLYA